MTLKLENNVTNVSYTISGLTDLQKSRLNYVFSLSLPEGIDSGEYNYTLEDDENTVVASGIIQIGSYTPQKTTYTAQTNNDYVQYEG